MSEVELTEDFIIRMHDIRAAKMCSSGARHWFQTRGLDWMDFLNNGVLASKLLETEDALATRLVKITQERIANGRQ